MPATRGSVVAAQPLVGQTALVTATLHARGLAASYGSRELFSGFDLVVAPGEVVGLVGPNGSGKSTLLRMLAGLRTPDAGSIHLAPPTASVGFLSQEPERLIGETVHAFLMRRTGVAAADAAMQQAAHDMAEGQAGADDRYTDTLEHWLGLGGADFEERTASVLADLGLDVDLSLPTTALSGGQAARAGLAALILSRYDVYLLDEPTNDLDLDGLDRLEQYVQELQAPTVLVSHDREFLTRTVTQVVEIDRSLLRVVTSGGGYAAYLEERSGVAARADAFEAFAQARRAEARRGATRGMAKGVNARRKARDNDKIGRAFRTESSEQQAAKVRQTERLIERLEVKEVVRLEERRHKGRAAVDTFGGALVGLAVDDKNFV
jgi:ATPase subunit of ABC transporter with duplicated ATPase domains